MSTARGGKYRIIAHLRGGEATETSIVAVGTGDDLAVLKRLKLGADAEPQTMERFAAEARICQRLDHPNLARLLEAGQDEGAPVLVFEYVEGVTLARLRSRALKQGGVPIALTLRVVADIAKGLAYAHDLADEGGKPLKLVHRDVSPDNVMVTYDGQVKLTDFGMATTVQSAAKSREDRVKGNVAYMAPEQTRAEFALDARADLFALGVIFWELLTGKRFWEGISEVDVLARLADDTELPAPKSVVPDIPDAVDALCAQTLVKVRDERIDSAEDLVQAIEKLMRQPGLKAGSAELAAFVTTLFADERDKMKSAIAEGAATPSTQALPSIGVPRPPGQNPLVDHESEPNIRYGKGSVAPAKRVVEVIEVPVAPPPDRRFGYIMAAAALVVIAVAVTLAVVSPKEEKKIESKPYVAPTRPAPAPAPSASAFREPEEVTIEIRVTPSEAKVYVDGAAVTNPHQTKVVPAAFKHTIKAEAEGFEPRTMQVAFDKERSIEIALTPATKKRP